MEYLQPALDASYLNKKYLNRNYVNVEGSKISFIIQNGPIGYHGINGLQADDILEYMVSLYNQLNKNFPCRENSLTMTKIEEAILWQHARTIDRERRGVEGKNKA